MKNSEKQSSWYEFLLSNSLNNEDYDLKIDTLYSDTKDQGLNIFEK